MTNYLYHEKLQRGDTAIARLRQLRITICGAGALGANLCETLVRMGAGQITVIDRDRVEERNLSTQPYYRTDVGAHKAKLLANALYRALGTVVTPRAEELTPGNAARLLNGAALVLDCFDNHAARAAVTEACRAAHTPCLHVGLSGDGYAEVVWDETYRVPGDAGDDVCDYPLARTLVLLAVAVAGEAVARWAATGERLSRTITLGDLAMLPAVD